MTKIFKKFFMVISLSILMIFSLFTVAACGNPDGREITPEFAYAKLNEDVNGKTRKEVLITSYDTYKYLELEFNMYNEETYELEETSKIYIRNVFVKENELIKEFDQQVFIESYSYSTKVTKYSLLKRELNHVEYYTSIKEGEDVAKNAGEMLDFTAFEAYINELMPSVFNEKYFPEDEICISEAYKKTMSTNVNRMLTLDIRFKNVDGVLRGLVFNYDTNKIHYVREYNEEGAVLYEVEYTYPGNFATDVKKINYDLFAMHIHTASELTEENRVEATCSAEGSYDEVVYCTECQEEISRETKVLEKLECTPAEPVEENRVESTCIEKGHYDEVVYCSVCESEISRETKELDFAECVDSDENGVCDVCKTGGKAKIGEVYYATFEEALTAAQPTDELFILTDLDFATGIEINKEVTINLNGKTLTIKEDTEGNGVFHVVAGGKLTINGDGVVDGSGKNIWCITLWIDGGEAVINGGTYINNCLLEEHSEEQFDMFYVKNGGKLTINGGVFKALTPKWTINKHDSTENTVIVTGGTFYGYNPAASETENPVESFVAEGYISIPGKIEGADVYKVVSFDSI